MWRSVGARGVALEMSAEASGERTIGKRDHARDHAPLCVDLFAGAGGFSLGAIKAGYEVRAAVEHYRHAAATYRRQIKNESGRPIAVFEKDVLQLNPHDVMDEAGLIEGQCDLLLGGPPCQGFSSHRLGDSGVDDPRNALLLRYFAFVSAIRPKFFLVENVPGMLQPKHAAYLQRFLAAARGHDYVVLPPIVINAQDYGVPQNRKRVFILGYDAKTVSIDEIWPPRPLHGDPSRPGPFGPVLPWRTASDAFDRPALAGDVNDVHMSHGAELIETFKSTPPNGGSREDSNRVLPCHRIHDGHKDVYGRIDPAKPSPTMTTACINPSKGRFVHPTEHHGITARQAARLQTFPDEFTFEGGLMAAGLQIGNAVPVALAQVLCRRLRDMLESRSDEAVAAS
ncbi:DNA cytosine methyltransferase [Rhizobium laguerreae]|uniref:DNA cytosine methyltransferase n=1 Tax=Rhizobium laguerreae TaxID=1076926 RepID=UPI001FEBC17A|nr:DNA cytosine methyltransferase [Rhizobium laguerreae]